MTMLQRTLDLARRLAVRLGWPGMIVLAGMAAAACAPVATSGAWPEASTAQPPALGAPEVYRRVAPAVAYVETELGTGSGALMSVDGTRYVLTNAHVVWPLDRVRLTFAGGAELLDVPVVDVDLMVDLALIGPVEVGQATLTVADGEALPIGSDVYLVGYPNEDEVYPQPTLGRGILSRVRQWALGGLTLLQSDATIVGGQSGGVMVDDKAQVIGITTWADGDSSGSYVIATSVDDLLPRVRAMAAGEDADQLGTRTFPLEGERTRSVLRLDHYWHVEGLAINEPAGTPITITATSAGDIQLSLTDTGGYELASSMSEGVTTVLTATTEFDGPLVLAVLPLADQGTVVRIESSSPFVSIPDPDNDRPMNVGDMVAGALDYPGDVDAYTVELKAGAPVTLRAESVRIDPIIWVGAVDASEDDFEEDDDSGRGPFGTAASLWFEAPEDGPYRIVVGDSYSTGVGGYLLTVEPADEADRP